MSICRYAVEAWWREIGMGGWRDGRMACDEVPSDDLGVMEERLGCWRKRVMEFTRDAKVVCFQVDV